MVSDIVLLLIGFALGLLGAVFAEDELKRVRQRRRRVREAERIMREVLPADGAAVPIAGRLTGVHLADGDGVAVLERGNIHIRVRDKVDEWPSFLQARLKRVRAEMAASSRKSGQKVAAWNGRNMVALRDYRVSRTRDEELPTLRLEVSRNDYAMFASTVLSLDEEFDREDEDGNVAETTLRRLYLGDEESMAVAARTPYPFLANGVGIMLLAFTDDNKAILAKRGRESRARPGQRDVSVVEGIDADADADEDRGLIDPYRAAIRACREELGVDDVEASDVSFSSFGVDMEYYQWNLLGHVRIRRTAQQLLHQHRLHAKDRWESRLEAFPIDAKKIFQVFVEDGIWEIGLVATYLALCKELNPGEVRKAADEVFGRPVSKAPWRR